MHIDEENNEGKKAVKLSDVVRITLRRWPWIIASVVVCVSLATLYVLRQQPTYKRNSMIVLKDEGGGNSIGSQLSAFAGMGMLTSNTNIRDEINKLQSPDIMEQVVRKLNLDMSYSTPGRFHDNVIYGDSLPVIVSLPQLSDEDGGSFKLHIAKNGDITLSEFRRGSLYAAASPVNFKQAGRVTFGNTVNSPLGVMTIIQGPGYRPGTEYDINVGRRPIITATREFEGKIDIKLQDQWANTIEMTAKDNVLQRADDLLDNVVKEYNDNWVNNRNATTKATKEFINERLVALERELSGVDADIASYQSENLIPNMQQSTVLYLEENQKNREKVQDYTNRIAISKFMLDYLRNPAHANEVLPTNVGIGNEGIEASIVEYNRILMGRNRLAANSSSNHPTLTNLDTQLKNMRAGIESSLVNAIASLTTFINSAHAQSSETSSKLAKMPAQSKHLLSIDRQRKVMESLYTFLLQKREENELSQAFTPYNTEVIAKPYGDLKPVSPKKKLVVAFAFLLGLFIPFGYTFVQETLDSKVRSKKDLEGMSVPIIGEIPWWRNRKVLKERKAAGINEQIVVAPANRNIINDAFRVLRTNINFLTKKDGYSSHGYKTRGSIMMLTSIDANNGKSYIAVNLAVALALRNKKVIVIDADLRHGSTSETVGSPSKGLSDYLSGGVDDWRKLVVTTPDMHGADVMPVGHFPPNPTELLENEQLPYMLEEMAKKYEYVLLDCPPISSMADSKIIEKECDRCFFVVRVGHLEKAALSELEQMYRSKEYSNMAIILNGVENSAGKNGYYGYSDGYHSTNGE